jgi:hypothetical protein
MIESANFFRMLLKHAYSLSMGAFGLLLLFAWAIFPVPSRADLTEVTGALASYSVEADQSWFAQHIKLRPSIFVLFKLTDRDGRFWSDSVNPGNMRTTFSHEGVALRFYQPTRRFYRPINGDGVKTYGLSVDGSEIQSVDDALSHDKVLAEFVIPSIGVLVLIFAARTWRKENIGPIRSPDTPAP